ncbi:unnamed protein product [Dimorphilus gyrociliatus]|uniref:Elongation of very long chain fatty acids protein n=1 Tax=Dimorphilus gyrociliatus TaxID=2664684 RepID=A0A7I8VWU4_9ANNE|nr:unnamed protein product [Dimorphilus gyrociliatus]
MTDQVSDFNYTLYLPFEKNFDQETFWLWITKNWYLSLWFSLAYVIVIFSGKRYMKHRPAANLRTELAIWSGILAIFSILGAIRTVPELLYVLKNYGWDFSICNSSYAYYQPTALWTSLFALSKVYELGDTIFIVLRKQNLIFLHWYHHITVLIYSWYSATEQAAAGRWFMTINYTVHAFMYSYYTLKAMRFSIPKWVSVAITSLQIAQMVVGLSVNIRVYYLKNRNQYCQQTYDNLVWSSLMYLSYLFLFLSFFINAYLKTGKKISHSNGNGLNKAKQK